MTGRRKGGEGYTMVITSTWTSANADLCAEHYSATTIFSSATCVIMYFLRQETLREWKKKVYFRALPKSPFYLTAV